jgi:nucleoside-diphosphate-sugar epimerase
LKTVVTGGAGFIGSHLVKTLLDQGREVVIADDFSRGSLQNLLDLGIQPSSLGNSGADVTIDLRDYAQALKIIQGAETVFHLAARIGSIDYLHGDNLSEVIALQTNLTIDTNVFRASLESNVRKIVYASSAAVYPINLQYQAGAVLSEDILELSQNQATKQDTEHLGINPDGGYGWAKLMGEIQLHWMSHIDEGIARIFNVYGENLDLSKAVPVIPSLFLKANRYPQEEFTVWGDGQQSRDLLYVSDCVDALLRLEKKASSPPLTANIGSGKQVSVGTIAEKVVELSGKDIKIIYDPTKPVGPLSRTADITRARALLDWEPRVNLNEGLKRTYFWIQRRLGESSV